MPKQKVHVWLIRQRIESQLKKVTDTKIKNQIVLNAAIPMSLSSCYYGEEGSTNSYRNGRVRL